jgi:hypothetical protein
MRQDGIKREGPAQEGPSQEELTQYGSKPGGKKVR